MDTIFMNSGHSKTSDPDKLLFNLTDRIILKRGDKYVALSNFKHLVYMEKYKEFIQNLKYF